MAIAKLSNGRQGRPPSWDIISVCAEVLGCGPYQITGRNRARPIRYYRHIAAVALLNNGYSLSQAGQALGGRDHSTIISSRKAYEGLYDTWPQFRVWADSCTATLLAVFQTEKNEIAI